MRLLFVGDIVGRSGRAAVIQQVLLLRARWKLDFVIVNGENAAGGFGIDGDDPAKSSSPPGSTR